MSDFWTDATVREALGRLWRPGSGWGSGSGSKGSDRRASGAEPEGGAAGSEPVDANVNAPAPGGAAATPEGEGRGKGGDAYTGISTDTRSLEAGALFVALVGDRFDAHEFLAAAAARGARGAVVERVPEGAPADVVYYVVPDTLLALGRLARHYRRRLGARVCAIVGSNGKTTTKDMVRAVLATRDRVHATTGNLNNRIGVPLTVLSAPQDAEALVVEAGTNTPGEIAQLAEILEPDAAIVTGIAEEHLERLGDLEGVLREETAMLSALGANGVALVADEPPALAERARALTGRVRVAGWTDGADVALRAEHVALDEEGRVRFEWCGRPVQLALRGRPNARNALLALGLGDAWGVDPDAAARAVATIEPAKMRAEIRRYGDLTVIADCYNANPASVAAAIDLLVSLPRRGGRVAVLGTMRELGSASDAIHRRTAEAVAGAGVDLIVATGDFVAAFESLAGRLGERLVRSVDPLDAYAPLARRLTGGEVVLLKGSRGVALERLLPRFAEDWGDSIGPRAAAGAQRSGDGATAATGE